MRKTRYAVILPVYNEAQTIAATVRAYHEKVVRRLEGAELIIAEDGSRDGTKEALRELAKEIPFRLVSGEARKGYTKAFKDALALPDADWILFSDSDGQQDPEDFHKLLAAAGDCDIIGGHKSPRHDPFYRLLMSKVYNAVINALFGTGFKDINAGFKAFRREAVADVLPRVRELKHCVMSEFMVVAHLRGWRIREVPIRHFPREAGASIFNFRNIGPIVFGLLAGLWRIRSNPPPRRQA